MRRIDCVPKPFRRLVLLAPGIALYGLAWLAGTLGWHWLIVGLFAAHGGAFCAYMHDVAVREGVW